MFRLDEITDLTEVMPANPYEIGKPVGTNVLLSQLRQFRLYLKPYKLQAKPPVGKNEKHHPATSTQIHHAIPRPDASESSQQQGIHGKAVTTFLLKNDQPTVEQCVRGQQKCILADDPFLLVEEANGQAAPHLWIEVGGLVRHDQPGARHFPDLLNAGGIDEKAGLIVPRPQ